MTAALAPMPRTQSCSSEKFYRGRNRRSGSGLGPAIIVHKIVAAQNGSIDPRVTRADSGTTVTVKLPLQPVAG